MGFDALVRGAVKTAKRVTKSLQVNVTHTPQRTLSDGAVVASGSPVVYRAIVEDRVRRFSSEGTERASRSKVTLLEHVAIQEPDALVLPGGVTGPILAVERPPLDPAVNGGGYVTIVWLGASSVGTAG